MKKKGERKKERRNERKNEKERGKERKLRTIEKRKEGVSEFQSQDKTVQTRWTKD